MAEKNTFYLRSLPAFECLNKFAGFAADAFQGTNINFNCRTTADNLKLTMQCPANGIQKDNSYKQFLLTLQENAFLGIINCSVIYNLPPPGQNSLEIKYETGKGSIATIKFVYAGNPNHEIPQQVDMVKILKFIHPHFDLTDELTLMRDILPEAQQAILSEHESVVKTLESHTVKLSETLAVHVEKNAEYIRSLTKDLHVKYEEKQKQLEELHQKKMADFGEQVKDFNKRVADFDARENTVVRRQLLSDITELIKNQRELGISPSTIKKRRTVHWICLFGFIAGASLACTFAYKLYSLYGTDKAVDWHIYLPISGGIALLVSTLIFYLKWNDDWFREHAHAEFSNRKLNADILRASWIAELFFESDKKEGVKLPPEVINSFTRNLFTDPYTVNKKHHPFDQAMDILGKFSKIKVGKGICEIEKVKEE